MPGNSQHDRSCHPHRPQRRHRGCARQGQPDGCEHDAIRTSIVTTSRSEIGAVTSLGRLIRLSPVDLPVVPDNSVQLAAGVKIADYLGIDRSKEKVLALVSLTSTDAIALGTRHGVVKRVSVADHPNRPDFELISLKKGDEVVGARQSGDDEELLFITSDAQLLRFAGVERAPAGPVGRRHGRHPPRAGRRGDLLHQRGHQR